MAEQKSTCRKRLVPFFRGQIGNCPGVLWECEQDSMFRVPWRHLNSKDWAEGECQILKEWAKYTNKYLGTDDYPKWKTQIRCALNKSSDIRAVPIRDKPDISNPYRVFQFVEHSRVRVNESQTSPGACSVKSELSSNIQSSCDISHTHHNSQACIQKAPNEATTKNSASSDCNDESTGETDFQSEHASPQRQDGLNHEHSQEVQNIRIPSVTNDNTLSTQSMQVVLIGQSCLTIQSGHGHDIQLTFPKSASDTFSASVHYSSSALSDINIVQTKENEINDIAAFPNIFSDKSSDESPAQNIETNTQDDLKQMPSQDLILQQENMSSCYGSNAANNIIGSVKQFGNEDEVRNISLDIPPSPRTHLSKEPIFTMTLSYGFNQKMKVLEDVITTQGCNLYSDLYNLSDVRTCYPKLFGPPHVKQIEIPSPNQCMINEHTKLNDKYNNYIMELLQNMERGIIFTIDKEDLYVQRLCKTRVFVTDMKSKSILLKRDEPPVKIFDSNKPELCIYLTIGQEITKNNEKPLRRVLICLKIEHVELKEVTESFEAKETKNSLERSMPPKQLEDDFDSLKYLNVSKAS